MKYIFNLIFPIINEFYRPTISQETSLYNYSLPKSKQVISGLMGKYSHRLWYVSRRSKWLSNMKKWVGEFPSRSGYLSWDLNKILNLFTCITLEECFNWKAIHCIPAWVRKGHFKSQWCEIATNQSSLSKVISYQLLLHATSLWIFLPDPNSS